MRAGGWQQTIGGDLAGKELLHGRLGLGNWFSGLTKDADLGVLFAQSFVAFDLNVIRSPCLVNKRVELWSNGC